MFRVGSFKSALAGLKKFAFTSCDADEEDDFDSTPSIIEQADAALEKEKKKIKTPIQYENLKNSLQAGSVNTYDGFRFIVQKQVNLNTVVSHFYWMGSAAMPQPLYQYRLILPIDDDKMINVATDLDFNIEGEAKYTVAPNMIVKSNFVNGSQQQSGTIELELTDESSATQFKFSRAASDEFTLSYMQTLLPNLSAGGSTTYNAKNRGVTTSFGFLFDPAEFTLGAQYNNELKIMFLKKVNPNRVHVSTDLTVDAEGNAVTSVAAEFMLKQSKLHMGIDSNLLLKSYLEISPSPTMQLQICAEMMQAANHYKFGLGVVMA